MAVTAKFLADFRDFERGVDAAQTKLRTFQDGIGRIDRDLSKFGNQFSGTRIIQEATLVEKAIRDIGGVSKLTAAELERAGNTAKEAVSKMQALGLDVPERLRDLAKYSKDAADAGGPMASAFSAATIAVGGFVANIASQALQVGVQYLQQAAENGAKFTALSGSFDRLADSVGTTGQAMLDVSRGATKGLVSDLDLMQSANKAVLLGLPVTAQEMGKLSAAAVTLGRAMGQDATKSVDDLITALGRSSPMILDNLGLSVKVGEANEAYAAKLGKTADALTDAEKKQAFYNAAMEAAERKTQELGGVTLNVSDQVSRLGTALGNIVTRVVSGANGPGTFADALGVIAKKAEDALRNLENFAEAKRRIDARDLASGRQTPDDIFTGLFTPGLSPEQVRRQEQISQEMERVIQERNVEFARTGAGAGVQAFTRSPLADALAVDALEALAVEKKSAELAERLRKAEAAARQALAERQKFLETLAQFQSEQFRQQAAAAASGDLGFLAGKIPDFTIPNLLPKPAALANEGLANSLNIHGPQNLINQRVSESLRGFDLSKMIGANLGPTIMQALTGGGNIAQSIGGLVGGGLTQKLFGAGSTSGLGSAITGGISKLLGSTIGGAVNAFLPGAGALLGPAIQGIGKLFGKLFGGEGKATNNERDSVIAKTFGTQDQFRQLAVQAGVADAELRKVFSTSKVKDFQAAFAKVQEQIGRFQSEQAADQERLTAAIEKYGFTFEQLGPALQKQKLDEQAKELIEDWRVLVGSGIDLTLVNDKMSEAINEYLRSAVKVGQEVPSAMRPILDKMLEQGTLTDEAGNKITDLESAGITFSETMTEGFSRVVDKLDELIAKLGLAGQALGGLPSPTIAVPQATEPIPYGDPSMLPGFATGTGGRYLNFGSGTPVMLHGEERVMTKGEAQQETALQEEVRGLRSDLSRIMLTLPLAMRDAVLLAR